MRLQPSSSTMHLVDDAIREIVAEAVAKEEILYTGPAAERLVRDHPGCGLSADDVCDRLIAAAIHAGIPAEMSRPR